MPRSALAFAALLLLHDPIITFVGSALPAHGLLGMALLWFVADLLREAIWAGRLPWCGGRTTLLALLPISALGLLYSLLDTGDFNVRVQFMATFILVPIIWCAFSELSASDAGRRATGRLLLLYVASELTLMLLQISFFLTGSGIAPSETYGFMIPGSQFNVNNLACMIVALSVFYNAVGGNWPRWERRAFNAIVLLILLITFSRLALVLYLLDRARSLSLRRAGTLMLSLAAVALVGWGIAKMDYTGNETIDASLYKAKSLATIADVGLEADSSTSSRSESYVNFLAQLDNLGLGSAAILNYSRFTWNALFSDETLYINPHSMVVEFGYWMGWPGLIVLALFFVFAYGRGSQGNPVQRGFLLLSVVVASSIPSSAIPLPTLWMGMLLIAMVGEFRPRPPAQALLPLAASSAQ
ncbi:hypothetical protein [Roseateles sp.]|uniref:hypothetical protein n=1 Tax=Roseateles sp. TaxID=1971397 RepID=UPI0031E1EBCF